MRDRVLSPLYVRRTCRSPLDEERLGARDLLKANAGQMAGHSEVVDAAAADLWAQPAGRRLQRRDVVDGEESVVVLAEADRQARRVSTILGRPTRLLAPQS
jgi:hypothetical protein